MSWMQMSKEAGQALANSLAADRPSVGKRVEVVAGRKHKGKVGTVTWHGRDQFARPQYGSPFQQSCGDILGKWGFRVQIKTDDGETFFVPAQYVELVVQ